MEINEDVKPDESGKFSQEYVHSLREENKSQRLKAKEFEGKLKDVEAKFSALSEELENKNKDFEEQSKFKELYETVKVELDEQSKFRELYETARTENESLKTKANEAESLNLNLNEKLSMIEAERRNELLEQLSDAHKEFAKDLPLDKLPAYVKLHKDTKLGVDGGRSGALNFVNESKKWEDYSDEQLVKIETENKGLYEQLLNEYKFRKRK